MTYQLLTRSPGHVNSVPPTQPIGDPEVLPPTPAPPTRPDPTSPEPAPDPRGPNHPDGPGPQSPELPPVSPHTPDLPTPRAVFHGARPSISWRLQQPNPGNKPSPAPYLR